MDECIFTWIHCQFILPSISPIAIFGSRSLVFGLRSHLCCQACLATAIAAAGAEVPAANCRGSQNQRLMFPLWVNVRLMHLFGTNSQGFWSLVQKNGTRSVPQTVPERKGVPETTHSGTHSGDKYVVFAIPPVAANFFYRRVWTFIVHELSSKWVKKGFCAG